MPTDLLFIYGTLLPVFKNEYAEWLKKHSLKLCDGYMPGILFLVDTYPGAVYFIDSKKSVKGIIVKMNDPQKVLNYLDRYEETGKAYAKPNEYIREEINVYCGNKANDKLKCWVYLYNLEYSHLKEIESGDFVKYTIDKTQSLQNSHVPIK